MKLGVIYGGQSTENTISIKSAFEFLKWINYNEHSVIPVFIDNKGIWNYGVERFSSFENLNEMTFSSDKDESFEFHYNTFDIAVPLLSGVYGEDGSIQGIFEMLNIPYTGNGVEASAISMNKILTKRFLKGYGINTVKDLAINIFEWENTRKEIIKKIESSLNYPLFVKPARLGSSIGISKVSNLKGLLEAIDLGFEYDLDLLIEEGIEKEEINVSVLQQKDELKISKPGVIISKNEFYSYEDKYSEHSTAIKRVASLSYEQELILNEYSHTIFNALNARGLMRIDYFIDIGGNILLNEINTLPSLGGNSVFPFLLNMSSVSNEEIVESLIDSALHTYKRKQKLKYHHLV